MTLIQAIILWQRSRDKWQHVGAGDTEPVAQFEELLERAADHHVLPTAEMMDQNWWQLFPEDEAEQAAKELTRAALRAAELAQDREAYDKAIAYFRVKGGLPT